MIWEHASYDSLSYAATCHSMSVLQTVLMLPGLSFNWTKSKCDWHIERSPTQQSTTDLQHTAWYIANRITNRTGSGSVKASRCWLHITARHNDENVACMPIDCAPQSADVLTTNNSWSFSACYAIRFLQSAAGKGSNPSSAGMQMFAQNFIHSCEYCIFDSCGGDLRENTIIFPQCCQV